MFPEREAPESPRRIIPARWHAPILVGLCVLASFIGLTNHGVTSWHEAQRLVVAREMHRAGEWIVPTINGDPYLAKPPLMYWCQMVLARLMGQEPSLTHLRLVIAIAGLATVLLTYWFGGALLRRAGPWRLIADEAAFWGACCLATGVLMVRSTRIAEIDVLLAPLGVVGAGSIGLAWLSHHERQRTAWGWVALATAAGVGLVMAKSVPALVVLGVGYGAIVIWAAWTKEPLDTRMALPFCRARERVCGGEGSPRWERFCGAAAGAMAGALVFYEDDVEFRTIASAVLVFGLYFPVGMTLARFWRRHRVMAAAAAMSRTHPILVLGAPLAVLWAWQRAAAERVGGAVTSEQIGQELEQNFTVFPANAPVKMLEAASFGVGAGSVMAIAALVCWLLRKKGEGRGGAGVRREGLSPVAALLLAWAGLGIVVFASGGNAHGRYLTPFWPGIALVGGVMLTIVLMVTVRAWRVSSPMMVGVFGVMAAGQGAWYGFGREAFLSHRSPRAMVRELEAVPGFDPARVTSVGFYRVAIDYELDHLVQPVGDVGRREALIGVRPWTAEELRADVAAHGRRVVLYPFDEDGVACRPLIEAGLELEPIALEARFHLGDGGGAAVRAAWVDLADNAQTP